MSLGGTDTMCGWLKLAGRHWLAKDGELPATPLPYVAAAAAMDVALTHDASTWVKSQVYHYKYRLKVK